jgi:GTPase SAR1 family protein
MTKPSTSSRLSFGQGGNHLKIGLIGVTNVGKSSLFNVLSGTRKRRNCKESQDIKNVSALVNSRIFTTIDPNLTSFTLFDERLDYLRELYKDYRDVTDTLQAVGGGTRVSLLDTKGVIITATFSIGVAIGVAISFYKASSFINNSPAFNAFNLSDLFFELNEISKLQRCFNWFE